MRKMKSALAALSMTALFMGSAPAAARAKAVERHKAMVDNQSFKVIRYGNGSVKVVDGGVFGDGVSYNLRERMRGAAKQATGCDIADDLWLDGKLIGTLVCQASQGPAA